MTHDVVLTSTSQSPTGNGWLLYRCYTCNGQPSICAAAFFDGERFDHDRWNRAVATFKTAHPHKEPRLSRWAQPDER